MHGKFITFEGGEGAGKSTQVTALAARLRGIGVGVRVTREPGGSPGAEVMRHILLSGVAKPLGVHAEAFLFAAARADHVAQTILPAIEAGYYVLCDRFIDSTRVYQGVLGNIDPRLILRLERVTIGDLRPDLTVILDLPAEVGLARAAKRNVAGDRFENESLDFHRRLREAYREIAEREPDRCVLIDAEQSERAVGEAIWDVVRRRLHPAEAPMIVEELT